MSIPRPRRDQTVPLDDLYTALSAVTAEVSHEVVHTLTFLRHLAEEGVPQDQEAMAFARKEIARLERLLGHLRRFKLAAPQMEIVRLADVAGQVMTSLQNPWTREPHRCKADIPPSLTIRGDSLFIRQILCNLLEHALRTAGADGAFGLHAVLTTTAGKDPATLLIWDNGPMIAPAMRASLFLPWSTFCGDGHPLRLAIAYTLVRGLGWSLTYERIDDCNEYRITVPASALEVPQ